MIEYLDRILELPTHEQQLTVLRLKEFSCLTWDGDGPISDWLAHVDKIVGILVNIPEQFIGTFLGALTEFHLRRENLSVQIPSIVAIATEQTQDKERKRSFFS